MKQIPYIILMAFLFASCGPSHVVVQNDAPPPPPPMAAPDVSYQSFYDNLSPYGQWIDHPGYGYVWMPSVGYDFRPYATNGHWVATDMGWAWSSDYPWGWATFHYGRWFFDNGYGWMWVPGQEWAPAWVSWRNNQDYYGWAPLGPNVNFNTGYYNPPANYWCFVPHQYVSNPHMNNYYVNESRNVTIINNTTVINNYNVSPNLRNSYRGGPAAEEVARYSGAPVRPMVVRENNRPGEQLNNNQFNIYRPRVSVAPAQSSSGNRPAPTSVQSLRDVRPTRQSGEVVQPANRNNSSVPTASYNSNITPANNRPSVEPTNTTRLENNNGINNRQAEARPDNENRISNQPNNNSNSPSYNRPPAQPSNTTRLDNNNNNRPAETSPANGNRSVNQQGQTPVNPRLSNQTSTSSPQNNATINRPVSNNHNSSRPASNNSNSNPSRVNVSAQNVNHTSVNRPSTAHTPAQRAVNPATNQTQKPQTKPVEKSVKPEEKN